MSSTAGTPRFALVEGWEQPAADLRYGDASGIGVDSHDRVYVLTRGQARVMVYEPDGSLRAAWGEDVLSVRPHGLTVAPDDTVYVVDEGRHVICQFSLTGELLRTLGTPGATSDSGYDGRTLASIVRGAPPFNRPTNLAVSPSGDLYVSDGYGNASVHRFAANGTLLCSWGEPGAGFGQFHVPHGLAVLADGRVVVCDRENERLQVFAPDGEPLEEWLDVQRPTNVAVDTSGRLYVSELSYRAGEVSQRRGVIAADEPGRMSVFDSGGALLARWGEGGELVAPHDVAVDSRGDVYVAEVTWTAFEIVHRRRVPDGCPTVRKYAAVRRSSADAAVHLLQVNR